MIVGGGVHRSGKSCLSSSGSWARELILVKTSARYSTGFSLLRLADAIRVIRIADALPALSEPMNKMFFRTKTNSLIRRSVSLFEMSRAGSER